MTLIFADEARRTASLGSLAAHLAWRPAESLEPRTETPRAATVLDPGPDATFGRAAERLRPWRFRVDALEWIASCLLSVLCLEESRHVARQPPDPDRPEVPNRAVPAAAPPRTGPSPQGQVAIGESSQAWESGAFGPVTSHAAPDATL
mmetsp:Transcript_114738/g.208767  ORF Transcript_114738/g.208767 Transcript_114738/m.208767 type:complete len:148 (+) Transcript_114738:559-1002(+)